MLLILVIYVFIIEIKSYIEIDLIIIQICKFKIYKVVEFKIYIINMMYNRFRIFLIFKLKEWFIRNV